MKFKIAARLLILFVSVPAGITYAQRCPPVGLVYVVRDEGGQPLAGTELESVRDQLPKTIGVRTAAIGPATVRIVTTPVKGDGSLEPFPDVRTTESKSIPALSFFNDSQCSMHFQELTLTFHQKMMRLIFSLDLDQRAGIRVLVVDSLPFQAGTFELDLPKAETVIPARQWKVKR